MRLVVHPAVFASLLKLFPDVVFVSDYLKWASFEVTLNFLGLFGLCYDFPQFLSRKKLDGPTILKYEIESPAELGKCMFHAFIEMIVNVRVHEFLLVVLIDGDVLPILF